MYVGRFAPSPTGSLHLGSLYTAVASFLDARANQGKWLLRIEDLDPPREQPQATNNIIIALKAHGLIWDDPIIYQSLRHNSYKGVISSLLSRHQAYYCECSRQQLQPYHETYPGFCRNKHIDANKPCAIRLIANPPALAFNDRLLGHQNPPATPEGLFNDFVIYRKDGLFAYQLAVVVDDIWQGVTHIVRGSDILDSTFKQGYIYKYLQEKSPQYLHLPVILGHDGQKLSKQNLAAPINIHTPCTNLLTVLGLLNQALPPQKCQQSPEAILDWAIKHWDISSINPVPSISP